MKTIGKVVLGGAGLVGGIIAAPVILPSLGVAIASSALTGVAGTSLGLSMIGVSGTAGAAAATGVIAGGAGTLVGKVIDDSVQKSVDKEVQKAVVNTAKMYGEKFREQEARHASNMETLKEGYEEKIKSVKEQNDILRKMTDM